MDPYFPLRPALVSRQSQNAACLQRIPSDNAWAVGDAEFGKDSCIIYRVIPILNYFSCEDAILVPREAAD